LTAPSRTGKRGTHESPPEPLRISLEKPRPGYTDGLIERRREDIDAGMARLAASLTRHQGADPEALADILLADLIPAAGTADDTALVVLRL
jgi:hypothetical protein